MKKRITELEEHNARRFIWSNGLQNVGDQIVSAKTILPWLLQAGGASSFFIALLVPIREAGSMLPQAAITGWVLGRRSRKSVWIIGSLGQFLTALGIGILALFATGWWLGVTVVLFLIAFSLFRSMCSISSKDVQGKTISKGRRGLINGRATVIGGIMGLILGLALSFFLDDDSPRWLLGATIILGSFSWLLASIVFFGIIEPTIEPTVPAQHDGHGNWIRSCFELLSKNKDFRQFVIVRSLMLVSALSSAFIVMLSAESSQNLSNLGFFLIASGLASVLGGRLSGIWSDKSSKNVMAWGAFFSSSVIFLLLACAQWAPQSITVWIFPLGFFLVNLAHTAIRVARKTYVVDMAEGDTRTRYVADANTLMGVILLFLGAVSGAIASFGTEAALLFLAGIGLVGTVWARTMREVSA